MERCRLKFFILDERHVWHAAAIAAAARYGYRGKRIKSGSEVDEPGVGFIRPHADPVALIRNRDDYWLMRNQLTMIQDWGQVDVYEDKSAQFRRWSEWMPETWRFQEADEALAFVRQAADFPIVSKADVGASSVNVRILRSRAEAESHVADLFGPGIQVHHCAGNVKSMQRGYVLFQRFILHKITWRVNVIGRRNAVFKRYCYPDRPVAQTGNVEPAMSMTDELESLLVFANNVAAKIGTKWVALDILKDGDSWKLLETSLAWPWPSPGTCNDAPLFGSSRRWIDLFDVMFEEVQAGVWNQ